MDIALLVGLCILLAVALVAIVFAYSYYIYTKNRIFTKVKFPILLIVVLSILLICLVSFVIIVGLNLHSKPNKFMLTYLVISSILTIFTLTYIIFFIYACFSNNKNKISYFDIANIKWEQKLKELEQKENIEEIKNKLSIKNPKYYTEMLEYYKTIVSRMSSKNLPISEIIADIVTFNDSFTHKWSSKLNLFQLQLTYKFCMIFKKNPGQK